MDKDTLKLQIAALQTAIVELGEEIKEIKTSKKIEVSHKNISDNFQDSLEIGTPSKKGSIKVYCDFNDVDQTKYKIDNAVMARAYLLDKAEKTEK